MATEYLTITWDQLHADARRLARTLLGAKSYRGILAIARGGLIPAAIMARELDIRRVQTILIESYTGLRAETRGTVKVLEQPPLDAGGAGYLIIDDLVDTGETARIVRELYPESTFACLYAKPLGRSRADYYTREVRQDIWVLFP
ncbi:xanthine phosphoribosyltransferase [Candidatus Kirkpatrickella diaphorinae]|uniref:Xanthine phosphoribosyltransferase n=1 Tax=Candidatus Kirkpatrickella diaphorinae TaxID=2984322 RepID=A0ABY6GJH1_9PROT|nr:xanthine phosphoribosyltransferase [Candidatus Kirkpatrickella diaphorinae]UYH51665.1 xanthine phosphoribosyltransferase [Candidatus Kirkpatrickella diaphorinae]